MHTHKQMITISAIVGFLSIVSGFAQSRSQNYIIDNGALRREISVDNGNITTVNFRLPASKNNILGRDSKEFSLSVDDLAYSGHSQWKNIQKRDTFDTRSGKGIVVSAIAPDKPFRLELIYLTYPGLSVVRKALRVTNTGSADLKVENVDVESLKLLWNATDSWIFRQYARRKWIGPYIGDWNDPLIVVHSTSFSRGVAIGNEAYGITKRCTAFDEDGNTVSVGLTHSNQAYPFRKWLSQGESWQSPWVFIAPYENTLDPSLVVNTSVQDFYRRHMGVRIEQILQKPLFVYNTWNPFRFDINDALIRQLSKAASECGVEEFIIDDGWQLNIDPHEGKHHLYGDWEVDKSKFPDGLKPVFDYIRSLGMKPGLWISIGSADISSKVYKGHPEYFAKDAQGNITNLHDTRTVAQKQMMRSACMGTEWTEFIKSKILNLVKEHGLAYVKLDFAIVTSAYVFDNRHTGCYATDHPYHRDRNESFAVIYERCMKLFDDLHAAAPELFIDCTFETAGKLQLMDYGIAKHAEGNWLSNIGNPGPMGSLRMRSLAWERSPALPATSLVIGNLSMNDYAHELAYKSLTGALPIMLGDPRELNADQRAKFRAWSSWIKQLEEKHGIMSFRQDIPGFGEPQEGAWDGFCRLNTDTSSGGIVGVFRQGAKELSRIVTIPWLDDNTRYTVKKGYQGETVASMTGKDLKETGFPVALKEKYDGELFEITK